MPKEGLGAGPIEPVAASRQGFRVVASCKTARPSGDPRKEKRRTRFRRDRWLGREGSLLKPPLP
jgi:hypothetical protein